ncbi:secreted RxLR effector protein 161-like [Pistacia vera]|uniref:secreted RxLR effector protein 161-like n=1 Tax=Pistacia vera TaxID=55513 RepID=UPI001262D815|nr:secreted RxLR effector protein 161-like [Pistacia vera]
MAVGTKLTLADSNPYENVALYKSTIGALQYLILSRLDIAFSVNKLSQFLKALIQQHWQACKRLLRYLKGTLNFGLHFTKSNRLNLECYTDVDWVGSLEDRRSTNSCCVFLGSNLIQWTFRKQKVVALSFTEVDRELLLKRLQSWHVIWCDNQSAGSLASNLVFHGRIKHIELDTHYVREQVTSNNLKVQYVPTEYQKADIFTKALSVSKFVELRDKLTVKASASTPVQ